MKLASRVKAAGFVLLLAGLLVGCASFPVPESAADTLVVIPVRLAQVGSSDVFGAYHVHYTNLDDKGIEGEVVLFPRGGYTLLRGLPAGRYQLDGIAFHYETSISKAPNKGRMSAIGFIAAAGQVTILNSQFTYRLKADEGTRYVSGGWGALEEDTARAVVQKLQDRAAFQAWTPSDQTRASAPLKKALEELAI